MEILKVHVEGVGDFEINEEPTLLQRTKINLNVQKHLGDHYYDLLSRQRSNLSIIYNRALEKTFPGRALAILDEDEKKVFFQEVAADTSLEAQRLDDCSIALNMVDFAYTFMEVCVKYPEGYSKENFLSLEESTAQKIWTAYLGAIGAVISKKKQLIASSTLPKTSEKSLPSGITG